MFGEGSSDPSPIHWIGIGIEDNRIKVPNNDCKGGQNGFVKMDRPGNIITPHWKIQQPLCLKPEDKTRHCHDDRSPNQSKVFKFFPEIETPHLNLFGRPIDEEIILQRLPEI